MPEKAQAASFEDFLKAPSRLEEQAATAAGVPEGEDAFMAPIESPSRRSANRSEASFRKVKVGLTIDSDIIDAIDDYIYHERKQGNRLKKNDVYEAALRRFLGLEGGDVR